MFGRLLILFLSVLFFLSSLYVTPVAIQTASGSRASLRIGGNLSNSGMVVPDENIEQSIDPIRPKIARMVSTAIVSPEGTVGKLTTGWEEDPWGESSVEFGWYEYFGEYSFLPTETLKLSFFIIPFELGKTYIGLDEVGGRTGYGLDFSNGLVNNVIPYSGDCWNSVEVEYYFDTKTYMLAVNGVSSDTIPFDFNDSNSVQSLQVHSFDADEETVAWMDTMSVTKVSEYSQTILFEAQFESGESYTPLPGTIEILPLPQYPLCSSSSEDSIVPVYLPIIFK